MRESGGGDLRVLVGAGEGRGEGEDGEKDGGAHG